MLLRGDRPPVELRRRLGVYSHRAWGGNLVYCIKVADIVDLGSTVFHVLLGTTACETTYHILCEQVGNSSELLDGEAAQSSIGVS